MRNQILITIDSLRFDVFEKANIPWLKSFKYYKAYTMGLYTLPSHTSIFMGKFPTSFNGLFDFGAKVLRNYEGKQPWVLNPYHHKSVTPGYDEEKDTYILRGKNIVQGFNSLGWNTIGCGGVDWFDNENMISYIKTIDDFKHYMFSGYTGGLESIRFATQCFKHNKPNFVFMNFGETHYPFKFKPDCKPTEYGNFKECFDAQRVSLERVEQYIKLLHHNLYNFDMYIMSDHGECMGEDGLWGHTFYHDKVVEVPILKVTKD